MHFFLIMLLAISCSEALLKLSAISRAPRILILSSILLSVYFLHPWAASINIGRFKNIVNDAGTLNTSCSIIIIQAIICILFTFASLPQENSKNKRLLYKGAALFPSVLFPVGLFIFMVFLFNRVRLVDFNSAALIFCGTLAAALFATTELLKILIGKKFKNELIFSFQLLMIFTAMFFPVIQNGRRAIGSFPEIRSSSMLMILCMILTAALSGLFSYLWEKRKQCAPLNKEKPVCSKEALAARMEAF